MRSILWKSLLVVTLAAATVAPSVGADQAATRTASSVYLAGTGQTVNCSTLEGGACFGLAGDELEVSIGVVDDLGNQPQHARFEFRGMGGVILESGAFCDQTTVPRPPGATQLRVMVAAFDALGCAEPAVGSLGKIWVVSKISDGDFEGKEVHAQECLQPTPTAISIGGLTEPEDSGQRVPFGVLVLLDTGVTEERGRELMELAATAYTPLGIDMWFEFQRVSLPPGGTGNVVISHSQNALGGEAPEGFDIVHTLTNRGLNVFGQADCIGGVRYRDRAFSVSKADLQDRPVRYLGGPFPIDGRMVNNLAANIVAHEIGHLMGGHHHYGNCVETQVNQIESCTIMIDPGDPKELVFSVLNGTIVRAHAVRFAGSEPPPDEPELAVIDVTVTRNGKAHEGVDVTATHATHEGASCVTDASGACSLEVVAGDGYTVMARINSGAQGTQTATGITAPGEVAFAFGRGPGGSTAG